MKLKRSAEKLEDYRERLKSGKAAKISVDHVDKIIKKLKKKKDSVTEEFEEAEKGSKKERLTKKIDVIDNQIKHARWLRRKIKEDDQ
jgi:hypothetical protein